MKYRVTGADRESGEEVELTLEAQNPQEASEKANRRGLLVASCVVANAIESNASPSKEVGERPQVARIATSKQVGEMVSKLSLKSRQLLMTMWSKPYGRIGLVAIPLVLLCSIIPVMRASRDVNAVYSDVRSQSEIEGKKMDRMADKLLVQSEEDLKLAAAQRAAAARIRGEAPRPTASRVTKSEAIDDDERIQLILDEHPDLRSKLKDGLGLGAALNLLQMQNKIALSDIRYVQKFATYLQSLPD